jgi:uncharacterized membrane protein
VSREGGRLRSLTPERVFLGLGIAFGLTFLVVTPPFQVADEYHHYFHAFSVSNGNFRAARSPAHPGDFEIGAVLPASLWELATQVDPAGMVIPFNPRKKQRVTDVLAQAGRPLEPHRRRFISYFSTARNSAVPYLPQAAGIGAGRLVGVSPLALLYLGRLANLAVWLALVFIAIRTLPMHRWVFVLLALTPMSLSEAASVSPDAFVNGLAFLVIALWLFLALGPVPQVHWRMLAGMAALTAVLAQSKQVYVMLAGLYLLIPGRKFATRWHRWLGALLVAGAGAGSLGLWAWLFRDLHFPARYDRSVVFAPGAQIQFILAEPLRYLEICWVTVQVDWWNWTRSFIGVLGWLDTVLPTWLYASFVPILALVALADTRPPAELSVGQRLLLASLFVLSMLGLMTSLYVVWNSLRFPVVQGIQGRYLIPFVPLLFLPLHNRRVRIGPPAALGWLVGAYVTAALAATTVTLVRRYYVG